MSKRNVMLVDDAAMMRLIVSNMLKDDPNLHVAACVANGREALDELDEVQPDLILLDIEMPEMDGLEFLRHARSKTKAKVVVLSSVAPDNSKKAVEARLLGADAVIAKPSGAISYDLEDKRGSELRQVIYDLLGISVSSEQYPVNSKQ